MPHTTYNDVYQRLPFRSRLPFLLITSDIFRLGLVPRPEMWFGDLNHDETFGRF